MVRELDIPENLGSQDPAEAVVPVTPRGYRRRRETNPTMQMSVRMKEDVYERFRALCERERRTNGDMLETLMNFYLQHHEKLGR